MHDEPTTPTIKNEYEPAAGFRTAMGAISSLLFMGVPVGLTEALRPGGDRTTALIAGIASVLAILLGWLSIRGTLKQ